MKHGEVLSMCVNLGMEKQCLRRNKASWASISVNRLIISFRFSNFEAKDATIASGRRGAPSKVKSQSLKTLT